MHLSHEEGKCFCTVKQQLSELADGGGISLVKEPHDHIDFFPQNAKYMHNRYRIWCPLLLSIRILFNRTCPDLAFQDVLSYQLHTHPL